MIEVVEWGLITPRTVVDAFSTQFSVPVEVLVGRGQRLSDLVYRSVAMATCRLATPYSLADIADVFMCSAETVRSGVRAVTENKVMWASTAAAAARIVDAHTRHLDERLIS